MISHIKYLESIAHSSSHYAIEGDNHRLRHPKMTQSIKSNRTAKRSNLPVFARGPPHVFMIFLKKPDQIQCSVNSSSSKEIKDQLRSWGCVLKSGLGLSLFLQNRNSARTSHRSTRAASPGTLVNAGWMAPETSEIDAVPPRTFKVERLSEILSLTHTSGIRKII